MQGAGGVIIPPETYWPEIQRICDRYGILLVSDEVICGFGRTGQWFGCEHYGTRPDLMTMAKALSSGYLPIGGVMVGDRVARTLIDKGGEFAHGFTYSAHPVCCAVALANLADHPAREAGRARARRRRALPAAALGASWPTIRWWARRVASGLLGALELVQQQAAAHVLSSRAARSASAAATTAIRNGLVMRATRDTMIIAPPLVITRAEIDELIDKAWRTLDETCDELRQDGWV